jgi:RimJ/RimL family protein N-acetyltransferase
VTVIGNGSSSSAPTPRYALTSAAAVAEDVERRLDEMGVVTPPGVFVIADRATDVFLGTVQLMRRAADQPGHVTSDGGKLELDYLLHRDAWGGGLAFEACTALLRTAAAELPAQPVILVTQTANQRSLRLAARLGFQPLDTFEEFDAEQTLCQADLHSFRA